MSNQYGKIPLVSGQQIIEDVGGTGLSGIVIGNESGLTCTVTLQGAGVKKTLYPGTVDKFEVPKGRSWTGNMQIDPTADLNNIISWPSSHVYVDTYGVGEVITGQYPFQLNRAGNIGNAVNFVSGVSTGVQNDNNAAGTQFIEATVLGSPSSNEVHTVDGAGWIGRWINPTFTKTFQWFSSGATALMLGAAGLLTEILGGLKVDQTLTVIGASSFSNGNASIDTAAAFNGDATNTNTVNAGTGNITNVNVTNGAIENRTTTHGTVHSLYLLATPFHLTTNPTVNAGVTTQETCTGGATGVPTGATAVLLAIGIFSTVINGYCQIAPNGGTINAYAALTAPVANSYTPGGGIVVPLAANGKIDVKANVGNIVLQDWFIVGYYI